MGVYCSHNAFSGSHYDFNRFRQIVARAFGGSYPPHYVYGPDNGVEWGEEGGYPGPRYNGDFPDGDRWYAPDGFGKSHPGIYQLMCHRDRRGKISPGMCAKVADELEALLPEIERVAPKAVGHVVRDDGSVVVANMLDREYVAVAKRFIAGCRAAAAAGESLRFS